MAAVNGVNYENIRQKVLPKVEEQIKTGIIRPEERENKTNQIVLAVLTALQVQQDKTEYLNEDKKDNVAAVRELDIAMKQEEDAKKIAPTDGTTNNIGNEADNNEYDNPQKIQLKKQDKQANEQNQQTNEQNQPTNELYRRKKKAMTLAEKSTGANSSDKNLVDLVDAAIKSALG